MRRLLIIALLAGMLAVPAARAQIHGTPPSVTSISRGASFSPGVPASVTSLGPNGFNGSGVAFRGSVHFGQGRHFNPGMRPRVRHRGKHGKVPVFVPVYVAYPYGYPYYPPYYEETAAEEQEEEPTGPAPTIFDRRGSRYQPYRPPYEEEDRYGEHDFREDRTARGPHIIEVEPKSETPPEPGPATVLIFRDGSRIEVQNYAIVGDTLYPIGDAPRGKISLADLDLDATRRANDERGLDFHLPSQS